MADPQEPVSISAKLQALRGTATGDAVSIPVQKLDELIAEAKAEEDYTLRGEQDAERRYQKFRLACLEIWHKYKILNADEAKAFFEYWSERSIGARKHKWEYQKSFDIKKRMERWKTNNG